MKKTKIVCTLGPASRDEKVLEKMLLNGMNVARLNFSHGSHEYHKETIELFRKVRDKLQIPAAVMLDTKGPEIRLGDFENEEVTLSKGDLFTLTTKNILGNQEIVSITYKDLPSQLQMGNKILIDDGKVSLEVVSSTITELNCKVLVGGKISNHKGVNVPNVHLNFEYLSQKDKEDLKFGVENDVDYIAASFVRSKEDVKSLRNYLDYIGGKNIKIISKIENIEGVDNFDEILNSSDGIMVARGDMGVEIPFEQIPAIQKELIHKGYNAGKQVITATQMLESMISNPRPTRAEITDVANAIYDGTSAIMLSGETAAGEYPIEAVSTMALIAETTEYNIDYKSRFHKRGTDSNPNIANAISHACVTTAHDLDVKAIITVTKGGSTARLISKYRPLCPIISCTTDEVVCRQMNMSWGVTPIIINEETSTDELFEHAVDAAKKYGYVEQGDRVVITAGVPLGISGTTNLMKVDTVK